MRVAPVVACLLLAGLFQTTQTEAQEAMPRELAGAWRITRVLPARPPAACWTEKEAQPLVGSELRYSAHAMRWKGGTVPLLGITTRSVDAADLAQEDPRGDKTLSLADLGFSTRRVQEINLQHDDADITGATTEVPGDSVLMTGPSRLVLSACGLYLEAKRLPSHPATATTSTLQTPATVNSHKRS